MIMIDYFMKALKNYANFRGRARRSEYWYFFLMFMIIYFVSIAATLFIPFFSFVFAIFYLAMLIPIFSIGVRRMHDVGKSGWFMFIPIYNLILACTEGEKGTNEYGPDPKANGETESQWDFENQNLNL